MYTELKNVLNKPFQNIVITTHHKPDADALGSSLALWKYFIYKKQYPRVISPTDYPTFLNWMRGHDQVINFENNPTLAIEYLDKADVIFCCDFSSLERINELGKLIGKSTALKVLIDHHLDPDSFADIYYCNSEASSTAELVYLFISEIMEDQELIDVDIAEVIYAGIMTDTGSFRYPATSQKVHLIVADLMRRGINHSRVHHLIYENSTELRTRFLGYVLLKKIILLKEYNTAYIAISREELLQYEAQTGDTEGFISYALAIENVVFAAMIVDRDEVVKLSFRSRGEFPSNIFARDHFDGGGHKNAAGGKSNLPLPQTVEKFIKVLNQYKSLLTTKLENILC